MSDSYFYSSLTGQEIEDTLVGAVRFNAGQTLSTAQKAQARQNIGAGSETTGFQILGYYDTLEDLQAALQVLPQPGDAYGIGVSEPYDIYVYDGTTDEWKNNGTLNVDVVIDDADTTDHTTWSSSKISTELSGKQATLTFDNVPTDSSNNPVKSGGVYDAIEEAKALFLTGVTVSAVTSGTIVSVSNAAITANHVLVSCVFANPAAITSNGTWTTAAGSLTLTGTCVTATTCDIVLVAKA